MDRVRYRVMTRLAPYPSPAVPLGLDQQVGPLVHQLALAAESGGRVGAITDRLNARFGRELAPFEPTEENVARCLREIDEDWRRRRGGGEHLERVVPRPCEVREGLKAELRSRFEREAHPALRERTAGLHASLSAEARRGPAGLRGPAGGPGVAEP